MAEDGAREPADGLVAGLRAQTGCIPWRQLQPHYARGAVVMVRTGLDLVDVAVQLQLDNAARFQAWIDQGDVGGVSDELAARLFEDNAEVWAVVVAPWVLVQQPAQAPA